MFYWKNKPIWKEIYILHTPASFSFILQHISWTIKKNGVLIIFLISALQRHGGYSLIIQLFTSTYLCTVFKQLLTVKVMNSLDILLLDFFWHSIISRVFSLSSATFDLVCCSFDSWIRARPTKTKLKCFDFKSGYLALCSEIKTFEWRR